METSTYWLIEGFPCKHAGTIKHNITQLPLPSNQCQYKNRRGNLVAPQAARHRESVAQEPRVLFLCSLMYVQMVESQQTVWNMPWRKHTSHWMFISWVTGQRPGPYSCHPPEAKWTRWYKVARCYYQLHVHLKRRALASSLPWNAENSRNPSEAFKEPSIISQEQKLSEFLENIYREPLTFRQRWSQRCRLHWIHIVYVFLKNPSRCKQGVSTWICTVGYFAGCFKLIIAASMKPEV